MQAELVKVGWWFQAAEMGVQPKRVMKRMVVEENVIKAMHRRNLERQSREMLKLE